MRQAMEDECKRGDETLQLGTNKVLIMMMATDDIRPFPLILSLLAVCIL